MRERMMRANRGGGAARRIVLVLAATALLVASACGDESAGGPERETEETVAAATAEDLLGTPEAASGEPVKIGQVTEGSTATVETTDEIRAGQATVDWLNDYRGGIGGRPIELVTCEMKADPAIA